MQLMNSNYLKVGKCYIEDLGFSNFCIFIVKEKRDNPNSYLLEDLYISTKMKNSTGWYTINELSDTIYELSESNLSNLSLAQIQLIYPELFI